MSIKLENKIPIAARHKLNYYTLGTTMCLQDSFACNTITFGD